MQNDINKKLSLELQNDIQNAQFLMIKDLYCARGLKLPVTLATFFTFLVYKAEKYRRNNPDVIPYVGYSNDSLSKLYSNIWFPISSRSAAEYLTQLKERELIRIEQEGTINRKIYICWDKLEPEKVQVVSGEDLVKEKDKIIESLSKQIETLRKQNEDLLVEIAKQEVVPDDFQPGVLTRVLFDKKYLNKADLPTRSDYETYENTLRAYMLQYINRGLNFHTSINYICSRANPSKIKNKLNYLITSLQEYLDRSECVKEPSWLDDNDEDISEFEDLLNLYHNQNDEKFEDSK